MDITISVKRVELEEAWKEKANALCERLAQDYPNQKIGSVRILFKAERGFCIVEVLANGKNLTLHAASRKDSFLAALVTAFEKIDTQISRYLDKMQTAAVKADPKLKDKIWNSTDLKEAADDSDLDDYEPEYPDAK